MATYFCQHDPQPGEVAYDGDDDGLSWEGAFQDFTALSLSAGDVVYLKTHAGIDCVDVALGGISIHGGCPSSWEGTYYNSSERTGQTRLFATSVSSSQLLYSGVAFAISRLVVDGLYTSSEGAIEGASSSAHFTADDCTFKNVDSAVSAAAFSTAGNAYITNCTFEDLIANSICACITGTVEGCTWDGCDGGTNGMFNSSANGTTIDRCSFLNGTGRVLSLSSSYSFTVVNSLVAGWDCEASYGILAVNANTNFTNCTFADNTNSSYIIRIGGNLSNCISWGNSSTNQDMRCDTADYCDIENISTELNGTNGTGNIANPGVDPQFLDIGEHPYELSSSTPTSVSQGADTGVTGYEDYDLLDEDRDNSTPSMGCYEYVPAAGGDTVTPVTESESFGSFTDSVSVLDSATGVSDSETFGTFTDVVTIVDSVTPVSDGESFGVFSDAVTIVDSVAAVSEGETLGGFADSVTVLDSATPATESESYGQFSDSVSVVDSVIPVSETETFGDFSDSIGYEDTVVPVTETETLATFSDVIYIVDTVDGVAEGETLGSFADSVTVIDTVTPVSDTEIYGGFTDQVTIVDTAQAVTDTESFGSWMDSLDDSDTVTGVADSESFGTFSDSVTVIDSAAPAVDSESFGSFSDVVTVFDTVTGVTDGESFGVFADVVVIVDVVVPATEAETFGVFEDIILDPVAIYDTVVPVEDIELFAQFQDDIVHRIELASHATGADMRTFTHQTVVIPVLFPRSWDPSALTGVSLRIANTQSEVLEAAIPVTLYTPAALEVDARRYAGFVQLATGAAALRIGDLVRLVGLSGYEDHTVKGYDADNRIVTFERHIDRSFEAGANVYRLSGAAPVDFSDTDTYPAGLQLVLTWAPTGTGTTWTEIIEVEATSIAGPAFTTEFKALYHRAYDALTEPENRLDSMIRMAKEQLRIDLKGRNIDISRIVDQRSLSPLLMALVAFMWTWNGDEESADEREFLGKNYSATLREFCKAPRWIDADGDNVEDEVETQSHPYQFEKVWQ